MTLKKEMELFEDDGRIMCGILHRTKLTTIKTKARDDNWGRRSKKKSSKWTWGLKKGVTR